MAVLLIVSNILMGTDSITLENCNCAARMNHYVQYNAPNVAILTLPYPYGPKILVLQALPPVHSTRMRIGVVRRDNLKAQLFVGSCRTLQPFERI